MIKENELIQKDHTQESFMFFDQNDHIIQNADEKPARHKNEINKAFEFSVDELPANELTEFACSNSMDSLYALLPSLARLSEQKRWITLIAPPANLNEKLFALYGIDISRVLLIHPKESSEETSIVNKTLKNGKSGIVVYWSDSVPKRFLAQWRKSVKQGLCVGVWINTSGVISSSTSIAISASIHSTLKFIKIINGKQFGKNLIRQSETILPKFDLNILFGGSLSDRRLSRNH